MGHMSRRFVTATICKCLVVAEGAEEVGADDGLCGQYANSCILCYPVLCSTYFPLVRKKGKQRDRWEHRSRASRRPLGSRCGSLVGKKFMKRISMNPYFPLSESCELSHLHFISISFGLHSRIIALMDVCVCGGGGGVLEIAKLSVCR